MSFFDDDIEKLYRGWQGNPAHPNSPSGGGGAGSFRQAGPLVVGNSYYSKLPHPDSPAGRQLIKVLPIVKTKILRTQIACSCRLDG